MIKANSHAYNILKRLFLNGERLTATDLSHCSNSNQYFCMLENLGLITSEWGLKGKAKVKYRYLTQNQRRKVENLFPTKTWNKAE